MKESVRSEKISHRDRKLLCCRCCNLMAVQNIQNIKASSSDYKLKLCHNFTIYKLTTHSSIS